MTLEQPGLGSDPQTGRAGKGVLHFIVVSEPWFRCFVKKALNDFVKGF